MTSFLISDILLFQRSTCSHIFWMVTTLFHEAPCTDLLFSTVLRFFSNKHLQSAILFTKEQLQPHILSNLLAGIHFDKAIVVICSSKCYVWSNYFTQSSTLSEDLLSEYLHFLSTSLALISFRSAVTFLRPLRGTTLGINILWG